MACIVGQCAHLFQGGFSSKLSSIGDGHLGDIFNKCTAQSNVSE